MEAVTTKQLVAKLQIAHDAQPIEFNNNLMLEQWRHVQELLNLAMIRLEEQDEQIDRLHQYMESIKGHIKAAWNML